MALLLLAHAAFPGAVIAATVDHSLRPEAAAEAAFVSQLCAERGIPHDTLTGTVAPGNVQDGARALRYALLGQWAQGRARWIATAHHQDDVAETLLMRARRGAGVGGLAAMQAARPLGDATLLRPLLGWSRAELAGLVAGARITPIEDPSNRNARFDRARIRRLLAETADLSANRLALAARNLRHAEDALAWVAEREWQARSASDAAAVHLDPTGLPYELRRRLTERAIASAQPGPSTLRGESLDRLLATLDAGGTGTIAGVKASAKHGLWRFTRAPARRSH